jgi:putative sterol carrier protein
MEDSMSYMFPSDEWVASFKERINEGAYKESGAAWEAGSVCCMIKANPGIGLAEDKYILLDLYHGECRDARLVDATEAATASFTITAGYDRWKQLFRGELDPVKAMMFGQINIKGNLGVLMKYTKAAKDMLECGGQVSSTFLGD